MAEEEEGGYRWEGGYEKTWWLHLKSFGAPRELVSHVFTAVLRLELSNIASVVFVYKIF